MKDLKKSMLFAAGLFLSMSALCSELSHQQKKIVQVPYCQTLHCWQRTACCPEHDAVAKIELTDLAVTRVGHLLQVVLPNKTNGNYININFSRNVGTARSNKQLIILNEAQVGFLLDKIRLTLLM